MIDYDSDLAKQVEVELKQETPDNQWSENYIPSIIEICCKGDDYFYGHHGAFDAYLDKIGLIREYCQNCGTLNFKRVNNNLYPTFCNHHCELEYLGGF